ncbi:MAG TPA: dihydroorotate dehydrogenase electron transfer subunit [Candidatus Brocadiales bacterium]|nr:dihydroorotate dehydrogenase electron transfer subunit [Candidatus Brocadiales bacterium]
MIEIVRQGESASGMTSASPRNDSPNSIDIPIMVKISDIIVESSRVKTFIFDYKLEFKPGQFIMLWIPCIDEKPFAISYYSKDSFGISALARGEFTHKLHSMRVGDRVGFRGPYGKGFSFKDNVCVVGGSVGIASLAMLIEDLKKPVIIQGTRTASELLYKERFKDMILCTDDGTAGIKGYPTDLLESLFERHKFNIIYTCGPEAMMFKVWEFCRKKGIGCEASLDRYVKCAIGVCGQCDCDGQRVCIDGPVFDAESLRTMKDFGMSALLKNGKRVSIAEYARWRAQAKPIGNSQ